MNTDCQHAHVIVNFLSRWGNEENVRVEVLQKSGDPSLSMTLEHPRCADCGASLGWAELKERIQPEGDLFDARFIWCEVRPKWMFWSSGYCFGRKRRMSR